MRFTDDNGTTLLDYWMESKVDSDNAVFWVEVADNLSAANVTIYIYYGKTDATTTSNIDNTFIFGDDFESGNLSKWTVTGSPSIVTDIVYQGTYSVYFTNYAHIDKTLPSLNNIMVHAKFYDPLGGLARTGALSVSGSATYMEEGLQYGLWGGNYYNHRVGTSNYQSTVTRSQGWHTFEVAVVDQVGTAYHDGNVQSPTGNLGLITGVALGSWWGAPGGHWDAVFVRKYVSPEPSHGSWGSEETVADTTPPTYSNVGTNTTQAGQPCKFSVLWNDNVNVSGFIFGTNNTGTWQNDTWVAFTVFYNSTAAWSNVTKTLNATVHITVEWQVWCNDTSNNWSNTGIQALTTTQAVTSQLTQPVQPAHSTYRTVSNIRQLTQQSTLSTSMLRIEALTRVFLQSISTLAQTLRNVIWARDSVQPTQTTILTTRITAVQRQLSITFPILHQTFKIKIFLRITTQPIQTLTLPIRHYTAIRLIPQPLQATPTIIRLQTLTRTVMHLATLRTALISAITPVPPPAPPPPFVPPPPIIPSPRRYTLIVHIIDLFGQNAPGLTVKIIDEKGNLVATLTTDAEGTTDPVQLAKGTYTVEIYKDEMLQFSKTVILTEPTALKMQIGIPVVLTFPVLLALTLIGLAITLAIVVAINRRRR